MDNETLKGLHINDASFSTDRNKEVGLAIEFEPILNEDGSLAYEQGRMVFKEEGGNG